MVKPRPSHARDFGRLAHEVAGFTSQFQLRALYDCCRRQTRRGDVLEVGSWCGRSTIALAWAVIDRAFGEMVHAVDPFCDDGGAPYERGMRPEGTTEGELRDNLQRWGVAQHVVVVPRPARLAANDPFPPIRFAFIDGDHRYKEAKHDIEWALKLGATAIFVDDYSAEGDHKCPWGVKKACDELIGTKEFAAAIPDGHDLVTDNPRYVHSLVSFDLDGSCHGKEVA